MLNYSPRASSTQDMSFAKDMLHLIINQLQFTKVPDRRISAKSFLLHRVTYFGHNFRVSMNLCYGKTIFTSNAQNELSDRPKGVIQCLEGKETLARAAPMTILPEWLEWSSEIFPKSGY